METRRLAHAVGMAVAFVVVAFYGGVQVGKRAAAAGATGPIGGQSAALFAGVDADEPVVPATFTYEAVLTAATPRMAQESALGVVAPHAAPPAAILPGGPGVQPVSLGAAAAAPSAEAGDGAAAAHFTLQVKAFKREEDAVALATQLRLHGYDAFVVSGEAAPGGTLHRVRVGRFDSAQRAAAFQRDFETREGFSTLVASL